MFYGERQHFRKKTVPRSRTNSANKHNNPDIPKVETYRLSEPIFVPNGVRHAVLEKPVYQKKAKRGTSSTPGHDCYPVIKRPLVNFFETAHGGGRTGGGGTSDEALSRAKIKYKKKVRKGK